MLAFFHRSTAREGEKVCGDAVVVRSSGDRSLLAVVDGLGHGPRAHEAASAASGWLDAAPLEHGVEALMSGLHTALHGTRGAAVLLCLFGRDSIEACSVGDVSMRWLNAKLDLRPSGGLVGERLNKLRILRAGPIHDDRVALFSDGISRRFDLRTTSMLTVSEACDGIFAAHRRAHDDASLIVADVAMLA